MSQPLVVLEDLLWAKTQPNGLLINMYSRNGMHVVHRLPLAPLCQGDRMLITPHNPKFYAANQDALATLGVQGIDWDYCPYC
ncbi:MAG TPA: hypothetical protein DHW02_09975 [Ktedonobacter sp.]|nr:hypothetical protein [Ktedonobacter sp.]